jgi:hypothetical protein
MARPSLKNLLDRSPDQLTERQRVRVALALARAGYRQPLHRVFRHERLPCGATCRDGHRCQAPPVWDVDGVAPRNGRCKLHGGLSTGARTAAGQQRINDAARRRARPRR